MKTIMIVLLFALLQLTGTAQSNKSDQIKSTEFNVYGNCGMCKSRIEKALKVKGVESAKWDSKSKMVSINYNESVINEATLHQIIADAGHDTEMISAKDETYNKLHNCCKYERNDIHQNKGEKHQH